tara:strand:+ start:233 stop:1201 length:969 start_codon:yes stop_codon:yes gene_type:complete
MPTLSRPRRGSLQFYPRKRVRKAIPSVNWAHISSTSKDQNLLGFITYKVGMASALVKDSTDKSRSQNKKITVPVTILEAPNMKLFSVRFYKHTKPIKDVLVSNDKILKSKVKVPKTLKAFDKEVPADYDDARVIVYSLPAQTTIKKSPDLIELAISADSKENKVEFAKSLIGKEIALSDILKDQLIDVRGLTKGKGTQGPVKRFGIALKDHKSEKGRRNPGSIAPWHPARVTFRTPMAGQLGLFTRVHYNLAVLDSSKISEKDINPKVGFHNYGKIKTSYILVKGSIQGPKKRQILITPALRPSKIKAKQKLEFIELITKTK